MNGDRYETPRNGPSFNTLPNPDTPQVVVKFTLPQDREWFEACYYGTDWRSVVEEIDEQTRSWLKYGHNFKDADEALEAVSDLLHEAMSDRGIDLW